jgi:type VI secretion system protein
MEPALFGGSVPSFCLLAAHEASSERDANRLAAGRRLVIMISETRLLQRLREPLGERRTDIRTARLSDSILQHLELMLNTWHGNTLIQEDYGIAHLSDVLHNFPGGLRDMEAGIRATIEKYEPRLRHVRVNFEENPDEMLELRFQITAQLAVGDEEEAVWFETIVDSSGRLKVRG